MTQQTGIRQAERGFTLVELAIVMIIIGLLIGGILKGQELINNSRMTATVAQVKAITAAVSTFNDQFNAMPGDITNVAAGVSRIPNCTAAVCLTPGDGDNLVEQGAGVTDPGAAGGVTTEGTRAFVHLAANGLLGGVNSTIAAWAAADALPEARAGGRWVMGTSRAGVLTAQTGTVAATPIPPSLYIVTTNNGATLGNVAGAAAMPPKNASIIDLKLDDGLPNAGAVRAAGSAACATAATAVATYATANVTNECFVAAQVQ